MSTDIIKFPTTNAEQGLQRVFHPDALYLWLEVTAGLTIATLLAWGVLIQLRMRKRKKEERKAKEKSIV
jgi:ABC-type uncharacterized transport system ATPase subunit